MGDDVHFEVGLPQRRRLRRRARPAEEGLDAGDELGDGEGLGEVVVSAGFEAGDLGLHAPARAQHDDGCAHAGGAEDAEAPAGHLVRTEARGGDRPDERDDADADGRRGRPRRPGREVLQGKPGGEERHDREQVGERHAAREAPENRDRDDAPGKERRRGAVPQAEATPAEEEEGRLAVEALEDAVVDEARNEEVARFRHVRADGRVASLGRVEDGRDDHHGKPDDGQRDEQQNKTFQGVFHVA